ncbi:beta-L-arabinofuranosidase domain-containing protein [Granulicella sp. S190]|uniref:beta-L-arabinofuranosidase domain-containing protein n=1 Tax=Granulicella sp. S190 TaxID=1747226 RepID=UPI00131DDFC9|nr:beta-L-arabinofuranosidase domain-containing protein [Granulicella sp. S190]
MSFKISRRGLLQGGAAIVVGGALQRAGFAAVGAPLEEVGYGQVTLKSAMHLAQYENVRSILMGLSDDSLLMPFRKMAGQDAPGEDIGGWYQYRADYDYKKDDAGLAPSATFGQWVSALSRMYAISGDPALQQRALGLNHLYAKTIATQYYAKNRFPAYCFDKLVCGLMDAHRLAGDADAPAILEQTHKAALPELPGRAIDREAIWRQGKDVSWTWDESYTLPENLYLVSAQMGAEGHVYREMADHYLDDATYFDPLARGENVLGGKHAYSYVNALCSAMQAYITGGSEKHLQAAKNGFDMLLAQSFATGGWGPDELLRKPGSGEVFASLAKSRNSFETPCGSYAHMKLTRYLLRCTRDGRYGDSMERVMYNTVLGAMPLQPDGHAFYYADYHSRAQVDPAANSPEEALGCGGKRAYSSHRWPCCSGSLPQVVADYWINGYFHEPGAVWVNLYLPSTLRWREGSTSIEMEQEGTYPETPEVRLRMKTSQPISFSLKLRIPAWAEGATLQVNGRPVPLRVVSGFATVQRRWKTGDTVKLQLPMRPRLEVLDEAHPETAAVMVGPRVLFALASDQVVTSRNHALNLQQSGLGEWMLQSASGPIRMVPFTAVGSQVYSTYLQVVD